MATTKLKSVSKKKAPLIDPFSKIATAGDKKKSSKGMKTVKPDDAALRGMVDKYKKLKEEVEYLESELKEAASELKSYGLSTFAERRMEGIEGNFKIQGDTEQVGYIVMDKASFIDPEAIEELQEKYGDEFAELIQVDKSTVKFNQSFLSDASNMERLVEALQPLGEDFLSQLFTAAQCKACKGAVNKAVMLADNPQQLEEMISDLRITHYVKK